MRQEKISIVSCLFLAGCGQHFAIVGESDTSKPIAASIWKTAPGKPTRLFYTELTGNDTEFLWDSHVPDKDAQVEARFELRDHPGRPTVYALPPGRHVRLKLDTHHDAVVIEETRIDGKKHQGKD